MCSAVTAIPQPVQVTCGVLFTSPEETSAADLQFGFSAAEMAFVQHALLSVQER